jgi:hypothetical protein
MLRFQEMLVLGRAMAFRFATPIVAGCLFSLVQLLGTSSKAMAADALFGQPRIADAIEETKLIRLANNVPGAFNAENDRGTLADDFQLEHLQLQLHRSAAQELAIEAFINALHDRGRPNSINGFPPKILALDSAWRILISSWYSAGS